MGKALHVLVVDDEPAIRQVLIAALKEAGYTAERAKDGSEALQRLSEGDVDVALCDIKMPGIDGIEVVRQAREMGIETIFLMVTAFASLDTAVRAMQAGAYDYITKPFRKEDILHRLAQIERMIGLKDENRALRSLVAKVEKREESKFRLVSPSMLAIERLIHKVAHTDYTVFISGESGVGKGVIARAIHEQSGRTDALMIPVNCGSIPENLLESEFFGHTKGAFTGADHIKKGLFVEADNGTLFLDEIGELPLQLQVKLLHVLEEGQIRPVGSERFRKVNVRIVAATNRDLRDMVSAGTFREDLFFRLNVFNIHIPPLRERREDILPLMRHFLERAAKGRWGTGTCRVDPDVETALVNYPWPGNVREMENALERAMILAEDGVITMQDLPSHIAAHASSDPILHPSKGPILTLRERMRLYEQQVILEAIEEADGDRRLAAQRLGIGLSSLYRKLEQDSVDEE